MKYLYSYSLKGVILLLGLVAAGALNAQCPNDNTFFSALNPTGPGNTASTACIWGGEYATTNVCVGATYTFSTCGSAWDTEITLINQATGLPVAHNDDFCGTQSTVVWLATFTGTVRVLVDLFPCGDFPLCMVLDVTQNTACGGSVNNDDPCGAVALPVGIACNFTSGSNLGAGNTSGVPAPTCANYLGGDVWFKFEVPTSGSVVIDSDDGTVTDGGMALYTANSCSGPFTQIACDDDNSANGLMPMISATGLTPGDTAYVRFWEYGNDNNGTFDICVRDPAGGGGNPCGASVPDACASACNLGSLPTPNPCDLSATQGLGFAVTYNLTNVGATPANPYTYITNCAGGGDMSAPAADVWYTFTASGSNLDVSINGNLSIPNVGLWEATGSCGNLSPRGCARGSGGTLSETFQLLVPGTTYYLQVSGGSASDLGTFNMILNNWTDCATCITGATLTPNPAPINGTFPPATPVTFTFTVNSWNTTLANWLHGVIPTFGPGWDLGSLTNSPPASCDASGSWLWRGSNTSTATAVTTGPGFYYDSFQGGPLDGITGNNFGDNCSGGWTFQWTISTLTTGCLSGNDLSVAVNTTGDGESGSWSSLSCNTDPDFIMSASQSCALPVDWLAFTANREENGNLLKWATGAEINSDHFDIERSINGIDFLKVGEHEAAGNSNVASDYYFTDDYNESGVVYYRLRQVDKNGLFAHSEVVALSLGDFDMHISKVYPNPVVNELFAELFVPRSGKFQVEVMDMMGKLLVQNLVSLDEGKQQLSVNVSELGSGVYFLRIKNYGADIEVKKKFVK